MNWEKGPVCGVDNCPSDQWRSAAGRTFCRFGHQRQNEIEYDHEDEVAGGRKIVIGRKDAAEDGEVDEGPWFGPRLYALQVQIFQEVLRFYTHWTIQKLDLDIEFEEEVKELWGLLIRHTLFGRATYESKDGVHSEGCLATSAAALKPSAVMAIILVMLALIRVDYPISPVIIFAWINSGELPFDDIGARFVPEEARDRMHFRGSWASYNKRPTLLVFERLLKAVIPALREEGVEFSQPLTIPVIHTVEALMLPLDVIDRAIWLAKGIGLSERLTFTGAHGLLDEPMALVLTAARIAYYKSWQSYDEDIKAPFWKLYSELAEIYYQDPDDFDERNVPAWTDERYNEFLDEYRRCLMNEVDVEKVSIQQKRVNDMFPVQPTQQEPTVTASDMTRILHEQVVPLPSRAPNDVDTTLNDFYLQGPPLYAAVLEAASRAYCVSVVTILYNVRHIESMADVALRKANRKRKGREKGAVSEQEVLPREEEEEVAELSSEGVEDSDLEL